MLNGPEPPSQQAQLHGFCAGEMKNRPFLARLGFAVAGLRTVARRERSFRTQSALALGAIVATALLRPGFVWTAVILITIAIVLALEMMNAALEYLADRVHPEHSIEIKHAKDASAGAVLLASIASVCVGALMLLSVLLR
jgi:diacylglycerol kinase (ATP)